MNRVSDMNKDLVFIVSGGRTGTKFFGQQLSAIFPDAFSVHEPDLLDTGNIRRSFRAIREFGLWHMVFGRLLGQTGIRALSTRKICDPAAEKAEIQRSIRRQRSSYFERQKEPLIVESYYQWFGLLDDIREVYPNAKIAGIVRDPRSWVRSWMDYGGHHDLTDVAAKIGIGRISPNTAIDPQFADQSSEWSLFERLCWDWRLVNFRIAEFADRDPHAKLFRFEDIFGLESDTGMSDFLEFVADHGEHLYQYSQPKDFAFRQINASSKATPDWRDWTAKNAQRLEEFCQPLMSKLDYGEEPEWRALVANPDPK